MAEIPVLWALAIGLLMSLIIGSVAFSTGEHRGAITVAERLDRRLDEANLIIRYAVAKLGMPRDGLLLAAKKHELQQQIEELDSKTS